MPAKDDAADKEKCLELGLDERTAKNTIANHKVTTNLTAVIHEVLNCEFIPIKFDERIGK